MRLPRISSTGFTILSMTKCPSRSGGGLGLGLGVGGGGRWWWSVVVVGGGGGSVSSVCLGGLLNW